MTDLLIDHLRTRKVELSADGGLTVGSSVRHIDHPEYVGTVVRDLGSSLYVRWNGRTAGNESPIHRTRLVSV